MRDKIAEALFVIDAWGISFEDMRYKPQFQSNLDGYYRRADAILALEVEGKIVDSDCKISQFNCDKGIQTRCSKCEQYISTRLATIGDLTGS